MGPLAAPWMAFVLFVLGRKICLCVCQGLLYLILLSTDVYFFNRCLRHFGDQCGFYIICGHILLSV